MPFLTKPAFYTLFATSVFLLIVALLFFFWTTESETALAADTLKREIEICNAEKIQQPCYINLAEKLLEQYSQDEIMERLDDVDNENLHFCHIFSHFLGNIIYKNQDIKNPLPTFMKTPLVCGAGLRHVVAIHFALKNNIVFEGDEKTFSDKLFAHCNIFLNQKTPTREYKECLHGLGHALIYITDNDLPLSLRICEHSFLKTKSGDCLAGIFMESFTTGNVYTEGGSLFQKKEYICGMIQKNLQEECYYYKARFFFENAHTDPYTILNECGNLSPVPFRGYCLTAAINVMLKYWHKDVEENYSRVTEICNRVFTMNGVAMYKDCLNNSISVLNYIYEGDSKKVLPFCEILNSSYRELCKKTAQTNFENYSDDSL
ncbi:MAG: hypothetical protein Q8R36_02880 [bacterium]|nr:hypothetical protein [bacterium]